MRTQKSATESQLLERKFAGSLLIYFKPFTTIHFTQGTLDRLCCLYTNFNQKNSLLLQFKSDIHRILSSRMSWRNGRWRLRSLIAAKAMGIKAMSTNVVYNINGRNHHANTHLRLDALKPGSEVDTTEFTDAFEIPVEAYCPLVSTEVTIASEALSVNTYIKRAGLLCRRLLDGRQWHH